MKSSDETESEISVLKEILRWTKFSGMKGVKEVIDSALKENQSRVAFQLSDGSRGSVDICKLSGIKSPTTLTKYWGSWARLGLGEMVPVRGGERFKRSFDLEEFGYELKLPTSTEPNEKGSGTVPENQTSLSSSNSAGVSQLV